MTTNEEIEQAIIDAIRCVPNETLKGNRIWTKAIFKAIADLGVKLDHKICSSSNDGEHDGGWLYDLIWYKVDGQGRLLSVPLILESEWHREYEHIKYDFEKLLISRSKYKVLIFEAKGEKLKEYFQKLEIAIKVFEGTTTGETYFLACLDSSQYNFDIRIIRN